MNKFLVINGPNLNMLGIREPEIYGSKTLSEIQEETNSRFKDMNVQVEWFQSNVEGEIINEIQRASKEKYKALIINPGGYSHTSVAIMDALRLLSFPIVEVHLTNTHRREEFRQVKLTAKVANIIMEGLGDKAFYLAIYSQL